MIPSQFKIGSQTIKVLFKRTLFKKTKFWGWYHPNNNTIDVQVSTKDCPLSKEVIKHNYHHELAHCIFEKAGRPDLYEDETLVDNIGAILKQYIEENYTLK